MKFLLFYFFSMNTFQKMVVVNILTLLYGTFATLYLLNAIVKTVPVKYFKVVDRTGKNSPTELNSFGTHNFVQLPNAKIKLHYISSGNANNQLMLFVHGFPECWYVWLEQMKRFNSQYYTVAVNMRGYGESDKPQGVENYTSEMIVADLIELITELLIGKKNKKCIIIAHDWGGNMAWSVAQQKPNLVDRLVLINSPHPLVWHQQIESSWKQFTKSSYMFVLNVPYLSETILRGNDFQFIDTFFGEFYATTNQTDVYKHYFALPYGLTGPLNYYRTMLRGIGKSKIVSNPQKIQPKTLIVWGRNDSVFIDELAEESAKYCNQVTVNYIENGTHEVHLKHSDKVNQFIADFLTI